jgi:hypothetical protein
MFFLNLVIFYVTSQHHIPEGGNVRNRGRVHVEFFGLNRLLCFKLADLRISGAIRPIFSMFNSLPKNDLRYFTYHYMEYRHSICVIPPQAFLKLQ